MKTPFIDAIKSAAQLDGMGYGPKKVHVTKSYSGPRNQAVDLPDTLDDAAKARGKSTGSKGPSATSMTSSSDNVVNYSAKASS